MARKKKPKKTSETSKDVVLLPGLGGPPPGEAGAIPPLGIADLDIEKLTEAVGDLLKGREFDSEEEQDSFLAGKIASMNLDDLLGSAPDTPEAQAQDLVFEAMEADDFEYADELLTRALKIDPLCVEALSLQATLDATSDKDLIKRQRRIVTKLERNFGKKFMDENKGHFWGLVETRSYMRLRHNIIMLLISMDDVKNAITECEALLELNPGDNQGARDLLRPLYLETNNLTKLQQLNEHYDESICACAAWTAVFERYLSGEEEEAKTMARTAHKQNKHVLPYFLGQKAIPKEIPDFITLGGEEEARTCAQGMIKVLLLHSEVLCWLRALKLC